MKLTIDSDTPINKMTAEQSQKIKRMANILRDAGFEVELIWHEIIEKDHEGKRN